VLHIDYAGKTSIEVLFEIRRHIEEQPDPGEWEHNLDLVNKAITKYFSVMPATGKEQTGRLEIPESIVDLWDRILHGSYGDLTIKARSGEVIQKVHAAVFSEISPVTKAMLAAPMREGKDFTIELDDDAAAVKLFFKVAYTGCLPDPPGGSAEQQQEQQEATSTPPEVMALLGALSLSHRWAASAFTDLFAEQLWNMISPESFEAIFEAALRHAVSQLKDASMQFARTTQQVRESFEAGRYESPEVIGHLQEIFGSPTLGASGNKRRRVVGSVR